MNNFIFDVDGTLMDTEYMYMQALKDVLDERGMDLTYEDIAKTFGITSRDALKQLGVTDLDDVLVEWNDQTKRYQDRVSLYDGVTDALTVLKKAGASLAIMTSKPRVDFERDVQAIGLDQYFSECIVAEDAKRGKPAPDPINVAIERLGADRKQTIYVGDTAYDLQAAHAAKVQFGLAAWNGQAVNPLMLADEIFKTPQAMVELYQR
ncbi:HAD family hydrolase [Levilactobacillus bambusae]|uniref:Phosphatase n=1 Tax=Levilactobacillus bambusae TaxID=2024736 RepID=A0A2V1MWD5_9LACO|nr:HAD family hydrolase [Levilactobacillus bambusae]PWF99358.1 phosphatase [Levilactobacillus bambusae]